jgi:hypothetical protein
VACERGAGFSFLPYRIHKVTLSSLAAIEAAEKYLVT